MTSLLFVHNYRFVTYRVPTHPSKTRGNRIGNELSYVFKVILQLPNTWLSTRQVLLASQYWAEQRERVILSRTVKGVAFNFFSRVTFETLLASSLAWCLNRQARGKTEFNQDISFSTLDTPWSRRKQECPLCKRLPKN